MKTLEIEKRNWFDKQNGNSYFSAEIVLDKKVHIMSFQYGYETVHQVLKQWVKDNTSLLDGLDHLTEIKGYTIRAEEKECLKRELHTLKDKLDLLPEIEYSRNPTASEIAFGEGATHYKSFKRSHCIKKDLHTLKRWVKCPHDGLRYYRSCN